MDEQGNIWTALLVVSSANVVVGSLLLDTAGWFVQYGVRGFGLLLAGSAAHRTTSSPSAD